MSPAPANQGAPLADPAGRALEAEPLRCERLFVPKPWGGRALERQPGLALPPGKIGETWELVDRAKENSVVAEGTFRGRRLRDVLASHRAAYLGRSALSPTGEFPVLVKFLDAEEDLSVQVHPHAGVAAGLPAGDAPKTECWYILDARPGSCVYLGLVPGVDARTLRERAGSREIVGLLRRHTVRAGDFLFVPGGTVHAIGAGVTLAEVQQTSDTTYRIYDWGRVESDGRPRPIHLEQALGVTRFDDGAQGPVRPVARALPDGTRRASLVDCESFAVDLCEIATRGTFDTDERALVYVVLAGEGRLERGGDGARSVRLSPGDTWLVPASWGEHHVEARAPLRLLAVRTKE